MDSSVHLLTHSHKTHHCQSDSSLPPRSSACQFERPFPLSPLLNQRNPYTHWRANSRTGLARGSPMNCRPAHSSDPPWPVPSGCNTHPPEWVPCHRSSHIHIRSSRERNSPCLRNSQANSRRRTERSPADRGPHFLHSPSWNCGIPSRCSSRTDYRGRRHSRESSFRCSRKYPPDRRHSKTSGLNCFRS